jgi:integrase
MIKNIKDLISQANVRLKSANVNLTIEQYNSKLRLRGTLPFRNGEGKKQQRLPLNISATQEGIKQAEREAHVIRRNLDADNFCWEKYLGNEYLGNEPKLKTVEDWLVAFEKDYFERREKNPQSMTTWKTDYLQAFKHLPRCEILTADVIRQTILNTPPDTKSRKRCCICLGSLAKYANITIDVKRLAGKYNPKRANPRYIPEDVDIALWYHKLKNPNWKWVYGLLATYGLRNHEAFRVDFDLLRSGCRILHILSGKTGPRRVWACYPEWFDEFKLNEVNLPGVNLSLTNVELGNRVTVYFNRHKIPFAPYNLRHAWAIRTLEFGLDISLAAQQMGHSLTVHSELYHHWISDKHHQRAYDLLMLRENRPLAPIIAR